MLLTSPSCNFSNGLNIGIELSFFCPLTLALFANFEAKRTQNGSKNYKTFVMNVS
jgi:hypothetical protein